MRVPLRARWRSNAQMSSNRCLPDILAHQRFRQLLALEQFRVHAHDQNFLVIRTVENADAPALWQVPRCAPKKIMIQLLRTRLLERMHLHALRVEARHHVLDHAVFAGGIHRLQDDEHGPAVVGVQLLL